MARINLNTVSGLLAGLNIGTRRRRSGRRHDRSQTQAQTSANTDVTTRTDIHGTGVNAGVTTGPAAADASMPPPAPALPPPTTTGRVAMPGMTRPASESPPVPLLPTSHPKNPSEDVHVLTAARAVFTPRASATQDLILQSLPTELLLLVCSHLPITDLLSLRDTCRAFAGVVDKPMLLGAMSMQNHAGWPIVFEFQGQRYPGTTYGNRKLCGECLRPKPMAHIIRGDFVAEYLTKRGVDTGKTWDLTSGMCWPCLWRNLVGGLDRKHARRDKNDVPIWKQAKIAPTEIFEMMNGSRRKPCEKCAKDIHTNAVPCPYCEDFGHWLRHKDCCGKGRPCANGNDEKRIGRPIGAS